MHPNDFFDKCCLKTGLDVFEIYDDDLKDKLRKIHPKNFLKSKITLPVYRIVASYFTNKGNHKQVERYVVMNNPDDDEYVDFWIDMFVDDYNRANPNHQMRDCSIDNIEKICDAVLPIG